MMLKAFSLKCEGRVFLTVWHGFIDRSMRILAFSYSCAEPWQGIIKHDKAMFRSFLLLMRLIK